MKCCGNCQHYISRPLCENVCSKTGKVVGHLWVRDCFVERKPIIDKQMEEQEKTKVCRVCGRELPISAFAIQVKSRDGHMHICKECNGNLRPNKKEMKSSGLPIMALKSFEDTVLVRELRDRGYDVRCTKTIEL